MTMTSTERQLRARAGAHVLWAFTEDRAAHTEPARTAFLAKFETLVDPDGVLDPQERTKRALNLRRAHMAELARRSHKARREAREAARTT